MIKLNAILIAVIFFASANIYPALVTRKKSKANRLLIESTKSSDIAGIESALEAGANIDQRDDEGNTPIMIAIITDEFEIVDYLLKYKPDIQSITNNDGNCAFVIAKNMYNKNIIKLLIEKGGNINTVDKNQRTLLMQAVARDDDQMVLYLLINKANIDARDNLGNTALMYAAKNNNPIILSILLYNYADTGIRNNNNENFTYFLNEQCKNTYTTFLHKISKAISESQLIIPDLANITAEYL